MFRQELPRVYELRDLISDPSASGAYFQDFDNSICNEPSKKRTWRAWEDEFQQLDSDSWQFLKSETLPYLTKQDARGRGWEQLVAILNHARAYNFLVDTGCSRVHFIPRASQEGRKTPDLEGELNGRRVLCEVKTVNTSDKEVDRRQTGKVGSTADCLDVGFFKKLMSDLCTAKDQIESYDDSASVRRIAFLVLNFDDFLAEYKDKYFQQIDQYLAYNSIPGLEIVFYNQRTCFHSSLSMQHAAVVNQPGKPYIQAE